MAFWQCEAWTRRTVSIHPMEGRTQDPEPLSPLREAWLLFKRRGNFDVVLTMGVRESLAYGLFCALACVESKQIFTEVFIDEPRPESLAWRLKTAALRLVARRALGVLTNSSMEVDTNAERFGLPRDRLRFVPMHGNTPDLLPSALDEGFILSAGRTLRDYALLLAAAPLIDRRIVIICGDGDLQRVHLPHNVEVLREIPRALYLERLRRCTLVALPLRPTLRSTGQVVMLEAMACGKPVVTTRSPGTTDIVRDGENGRLVPPGDARALAGAVNDLLRREDYAAQLAARAREDLSKLHTFDVHAAAKLAAIAALWNAASPRA